VREHVVRRPSPAAPSASEAAVAAAAAAATRGARALRRAAGVRASAGAAAYTVFSGAMNIGFGVGVSRIHRLCGIYRRRGGRRRCIPWLRTYDSSSTTGTAPIKYNMRHADPAATSVAARPTTFPLSSRPAGGGERQWWHGWR